MTRSMTGFGAARREDDDLRARVEIRSVNNRFLKVVVKSPSLLSARDAAIERRVRDRVERGSVTISVWITLDDRTSAFQFNAAAARSYRDALVAHAAAENIPGEVTISDIAVLPGVFEPAETDIALDDDAWGRVAETIDEALDAMIAMRTEEGASLREEFLTRQKAIETLLEVVTERAPVVADDYRTRLEEKLTKLLVDRDVVVTDADLIREVAIFADRCDITEELTRLKSHLAQYGQIVGAGGTAGRRLEFILQEMLRETNTIGAKANDYAIAERIVAIKAEIEKLKEQVQNVE